MNILKLNSSSDSFVLFLSVLSLQYSIMSLYMSSLLLKNKEFSLEVELTALTGCNIDFDFSDSFLLSFIFSMLIFPSLRGKVLFVTSLSWIF